MTSSDLHIFLDFSNINSIEEISHNANIILLAWQTTIRVYTFHNRSCFMSYKYMTHEHSLNRLRTLLHQANTKRFNVFETKNYFGLGQGQFFSYTETGPWGPIQKSASNRSAQINTQKFSPKILEGDHLPFQSTRRMKQKHTLKFSG